ncbi:MAG: helix-turn-helix transcriptional regulator [Erysipelotrichaceae bacterium]|nr:helix-turn-helix transcriptional regulator [Erysipelotrichaceae bacterium]
MKFIDGFGEKLRELRENAGFTQQQLAEQMGMSKATISQYESQERVPSPVSIVKISAIFHVSTDYLYGLDKIRRADLSGLTDDDIEIINRLIESMRMKNNKISDH